MIVVRNATMKDAERILEIYDYYVKNTAITFEYDTPSLKEFKATPHKDCAADVQSELSADCIKIAQADACQGIFV